MNQLNETDQKLYKVRVTPLARGFKVEVTLDDLIIAEGYCEKQYRVPQCLKDIFAKEFPTPERKKRSESQS